MLLLDRGLEGVLRYHGYKYGTYFNVYVELEGWSQESFSWDQPGYHYRDNDIIFDFDFFIIFDFFFNWGRYSLGKRLNYESINNFIVN